MMKKIPVIFIVCVLVVTPVVSQAAVTNAVFNSLPTNEKIAYLYGMIAQLQMLIELRLDQTDSQSSRERNRADVDIETRSATDITEDEAELRAALDLNGEDWARVWFEYGEDDDDLDERTAKRRVTDSRGDAVDVEIIVADLDEDERYYFRAVAEDEAGDRRYGSIRNFTTDDDRNSGSHSDDFELEVSDTTIDEGDDVDVDWEIPDGDRGTRNWIGLYEVGDTNRSYVEWVYIDNDDSGSETFEIDDEGEYEFRLFLDNSYDDEITSDEIEVR